MISSTPRRTDATVRVRLSCMRLIAANRWPISLVLRTSMRPVKSPAEIFSKWLPASRNGRSTVRLMNSQHPSASAREIASMTMVTVRDTPWATPAWTTSSSVLESTKSSTPPTASRSAVFAALPASFRSRYSCIAMDDKACAWRLNNPSNSL
ncbi:hypothetical protein JL37_15565 [Achromobacter sp. RTa]|nr:hypothetical protein JL37_15565 [Achromobacter sp. RTa]